MKFLLIYPPGEWSVAGDKPVLKGQSVPPLGLLYLGRVLEDAGHNIEIIDYQAEPINEEKLKDAVDRSDVIGITIMTISLSNSQLLIEKIKEFAPEKPVIIGGPHCSLFPKQSLNELQADISVEGDGVSVICDIAEALQGKRQLSKIHSIHYKTKNNEIKSGLPIKLIDDLDSIPFPARHLVKKYQYGQIYKADIEKEKFSSIITSFGCPHQCSFCTRQYIGMKKYRMRSKENIIMELKELSDQGYEYIIISDDSFLSHAKRAYEIMDEIVKRKLHFTIFLQGARVDSASEKLYQKMKDAGVKGIAFGIESGNQDVLDYYKKGITVEQIQYAIRLSHKMEFITFGSFILGAPIETKKHFKKTIKCALSLPFDVVSFFPLEYRVGSKIWQDAVDKGLIKPEEYAVPSDINRGLGKYIHDEITKYCLRAHKMFYFRPLFIFKKFFQFSIEKDFSFMYVGLHVFRDNIRKFLQ